MRTTNRSDTEAMRISNRRAWKDGWYEGVIQTAIEKFCKNDNEMIELAVLVTGRDGAERVLSDWLTDSDLGASKLRHCCESAGVLDKYEQGRVTQDDFPGKHIQVKLITQKRNGFSGNRIDDYRAL